MHFCFGVFGINKVNYLPNLNECLVLLLNLRRKLKFVVSLL